MSENSDTQTSPQEILVTVDEGVGLLTLNRPEALNALTGTMVDALIQGLESLDGDPEVAAIVLTGNGKAFCAGLDLKNLAAGGQGGLGGDELGPDTPMMRALGGCRKPLLGAINGFAVTGGFELALACDFLYAARSARFADTHARVGLLPGWGLSQKLPRLVGVNRAREISFTGNYFSAAEAERWGLVNQVLDDEALLPAALATARQMADCDPDALRGIKGLVNRGWESTLGQGLALEGERAIAFNGQVDLSQMERRLAELKTRSRRQ